MPLPLIIPIIILYVIVMVSRAAKVNKQRPGDVRPPQNAAGEAASGAKPRNRRTAQPTLFKDTPEVETVHRPEHKSTGSDTPVRTVNRGFLNAKSMRKAMIVSEIISKPVSMRGDCDRF